MRQRKPDVISDLWYKNAVIYNCDVRTYLDSNGDGVGDFRGLTRRLDYLAGLGIGAVWLMPFYASPDKDDGYDITDHYSVDPRYGTLGDFVEFAAAAKQRGIRVILFSEAHSEPGAGKAHKIPLEPYGYRWFRAGGLD